LSIANNVFLTSFDLIKPAIKLKILDPAFATVLTALSAKPAIPVSCKKLDCFAVSQAELRRFPVHDPNLSPSDTNSFALLNNPSDILNSLILAATSFIVPTMTLSYNLEASPD
jgi:hypothetical protein